MANNERNRRLAHIPTDDEDARPPEIRGPPRRSPTRHRLPRRNDIQEQHESYESFFNRDTPFTWEEVQRFARFESTWPIPWLPHSPFDGASLRLYVWRGDRPTPAEHWEQSVARMPYLAQQEEIKTFVHKFARATYEITRGAKSKRCPCCGSQLLGQPLYDHGILECPFYKKLPRRENFQFIATNMVAFCQRCNSRSATHTGCRPLVCSLCNSPDHTVASGICHNAELRNLTEEQLRERANIIRREYLHHIRNLLESADNPLRYRLPSDSPYISLYRRQVPAGEIRSGLQFLRVPPDQFPGTQLQQYRGASGSGIREFPTLRPPEFDIYTQLQIPVFDVDSARYLEDIARVVTRIRESPETAGTFDLPEAPLPNRDVLRQERPNEVLAAEPRARPAYNGPAGGPQVNQPVRQVQPQVETPILRSDPPGLRMPPPVPWEVVKARREAAAKQAASARGETAPRPLTNDPGSQPCSSSQIAPHMSDSTSSSAQTASSSTINVDNMFDPETYQSMESWSVAMNRRTEAQQRATSRASVYEDTESQGERTLENSLNEAPHHQPVQHEQMSGSTSQNNSTSTPNEGSLSTTRPSSRESAVERSSSQGSRLTASSQNREQLEAQIEEDIQADAIYWCHEALRIDGTLARPAFQETPFEKMTRLPPVEGTAARIIRIQTLQFIITAQKDDRMEKYYQCDPRIINNYLQMLFSLGQALAREDFMIVMLEKHHNIPILHKARSGRDILHVPSIDIWRNPHVSNAMERILGSAELGVPHRLLNFRVTETRHWFEFEFPGASPLSVEDQRGQELYHLDTVEPAIPLNPRELDQLEAKSRIPLPTDMVALRTQIQWMTIYLSGSTVVDQDYVQRNKIIAYAELLRAILALLIHLRRELNINPPVRFYDCEQELGSAAARCHNIVAPTLRRYAYKDVTQMKAYLQTVWTSFVELQEEKARACWCSSLPE